jgi:hypothetical protein
MAIRVPILKRFRNWLQDLSHKVPEFPLGPPGIWAYPNTYSVFPGDTLKLSVSGRCPFFGFKIFKLTDWDGSGNNPIFTSSRHNKPSSFTAPNNGGTGREQTGTEDWNWPVTASYPIGLLPSGIYFAEVSGYATDRPSEEPQFKSLVYFVVKNPSPQPDARILLKVNLATIHAYNGAGIGDDAFTSDFYNFPRQSPWSPLPKGYKVTMRRPVAATPEDQFGWPWEHKLAMYAHPMAKWLERQGYAVDFFTDVDLHMDTQLRLLSKYSLVLSVGHDEYWSQEMRDNLGAFIKQGGNVAFLSGNTCYWRIQFTDPDPELGNIPTGFVSDKGPPRSMHDGAGPDAWWQLNAPENALTGVSIRSGGLRPEEDALNETGPFGRTAPSSVGYTVQNAEHWVFQGTGLRNGDVIGVGNALDTQGKPLTENLIGYEVDGARCEEVDGKLRPTHTDGTPESFEVLAFARLEPYSYAGERKSGSWNVFLREDSKPGEVSGLYAATLGMYENTGRVFTAATIYWSRVLNEWDAEFGHWRGVPRHWKGLQEPPLDAAGHPICGNRYLHTITRNVLDAFTTPR